MRRIQSGDGVTDLGSTEQSTPAPQRSVKIYHGDDLLYDSTQSHTLPTDTYGISYQTWQQFLARHRDTNGWRIEFTGTAGSDQQ